MPRQKEFERQEVLEKALQVFWQHGYKATSFTALTKGMNINRQSIYDTYGDKHSLFIESLNYYAEKNTAAVSAHFKQDKPVKTLFRDFLGQAINDICVDNLRKGCFIANSLSEMSAHDEGVKMLVEKNIDMLHHIFLKAIKKGVSTGEITGDTPPQVLSMHLINTIHGLKTLGKIIDNKAKLNQIAETALCVL